MTTKESYLQSVYKVIFYIEKNYANDLSLEELSLVAGFSKYHFHRIFKSIMDENVGDYIRRVRLNSTISKFKMNKNITQIALESGYETNASFTKAFKKRFGMSPREFSKTLKKIERNKMIKPKIIEIDPIEVLYVRKTGEYMSSADAAWKNLVEDLLQLELIESVAVRYGISHDNPTLIEADKLRYDACVEFKDKLPNVEGKITYKALAGGTYAVFTHEGAYEKIGESFKAVGSWIIENEITLRDEPQFQKYLDLDPTIVKEQDLRTEIYVPIEKS